MEKIKKLLSIMLVLLLCVTMLPLSSIYADVNADVGKVKGGTGTGTSDFKFSSEPMGVRVSIYYAPKAEGDIPDEYESNFKIKSDGTTDVKQIGTTTDFIASDPQYGVDFYTNTSVFDYMNGDKKAATRYVFSRILSDAIPYTYVKVNGSNSKVTGMPNPKTATQELWTDWFESPIKVNGVITDYAYTNIPIISAACGEKISAADFKAGVYRYTKAGVKYEEKVVYKIFFEPLISAVIDGKATMWTFRDALKYAEAREAAKKEPDLQSLVYKMNMMFSYQGNLVHIIENEGNALNMKANSYQIPEFTRDSNKKLVDSVVLGVVKQLKRGGQGYNTLGVGVVNPIRRKSNSSDSVKVIKSYVALKQQKDGSYSYEQVKSSLAYVDKNDVADLIDPDARAEEEGTAYLNDIFTSPVDLLDSKGATASNIVWTDAIPVNKKTDETIEVMPETIWSYNMGLRTRAYYCAAKNIPFGSTEYYELEKLRNDFLDTFYTEDENSESNLAKRDRVFSEMMALDNETFNDASFNEYLKKFPNAQNYLDDILGTAKTDNVGSSLVGDYATWIIKSKDIVVENPYTSEEDYDQINADRARFNIPPTEEYMYNIYGDVKDGVIYLRYILETTPKQRNFVNIYKDGVLQKTVIASTVTPMYVKKFDGYKTTFDITSLSAISGTYKGATLEKWSTAKGVPLLTKYPKASIQLKTGTALESISDLKELENVYVTWRVDTYSEAETLEVPEWRLSKYYTGMGYDSKAYMFLALTPDAGHLAPFSTLSPSGNYNYNTVNPNGKITTAENTPTNMKYMDWLHTKAITKGSYSVTHSNPSAAVDVTGLVNAIKSTDLTGTNIASWTVTSGDKSLLATYDLNIGSKSIFSNSSLEDIVKVETLSYAIRNKDTYTHAYGCQYDTTKYGTYYNSTTKETITYSYTVCNCTLASENPSASYVNADYKLRTTFNRYKAKSTTSDVLKVTESKKSEDNGKTTIAKKNSSSLYIFPEIPMLFQEDNGDYNIFFAVGTQKRQITLVDYHTLTYTAYVNDAKVTPSSMATDSKAKSTAKSVGLGSLPVALKGSNLSVAFDVQRSKNSNSSGTLTVKSYALDIDDNSLKSTWGNSSYNSKQAHTSLLSSFNNFSSGTATENLEIAVPNGSNVAYTGATVKNKISYKEKDNTTVKHTLTVRGGVLTEVDGKSLASIKANDKELYEALVGMKLIGADKDKTVFATLVDEEGAKLNESTFATLANKARGVSDIAVGSGWYFEDTTTLVVMEYVTTYELPISMFSDKIPMTVKGLETPINKTQFFNKISKGYNTLNYTMTSQSLGTGLGKVKVYFEHNSRTDSTFGDNGPSYGVGNVSITDSTFGGGF